MKWINSCSIITLLLVVVTGQNAWATSLQGRDLDGDINTFEAYYDIAQDITWLADANYSKTIGGYNVMNWIHAVSFPTGLNIGGITGWRLPDTVQPDVNCQNQESWSYGYNCTGSEMGFLFYNVLGGSAGSSIIDVHNDNYNLFSNIESGHYWSTEESLNYSWGFNMSNGYQGFYSKSSTLFAWVVHSGDVGVAATSPVTTVPVPPAIWLFGSGLLGLIGCMRKA